MNNGVMHRPKSMRIKEKGFTKSTGVRPLICLQMTLETCYTRHGWFPISWKGIDHSNRFGMVSHKLPPLVEEFSHLPPIVESILLGTANGIG
jgi:hypothetical protein